MPPSSETLGLPSSSAQQALVRPVLPAITYGSGMQPKVGIALNVPNLPDQLKNAPFLTEEFLVNLEGTIPQGQVFESFDRTQNNRVFWRAKINFGSTPGNITTVLPPWKNPRDWEEIHRCSGSTPRHKTQAYTKSMDRRRWRLSQVVTNQNNRNEGYAPAGPHRRSAPIATTQYNSVLQQPVLGSGSQGSQNPSVSSVQHAGKEDIQATWDRAMFITDDFIRNIVLPLKAGYVFETWNRTAKCRYLWQVKLEILPSTDPNKPLPGRDLAYWELLDVKSGSPAVEKLQRYDAAVARAQMPVPYMSPPSNGSGGSGRQSQFGTAPPPAKTVPRAMNDPNPLSHGAVSFPVASIARAHALAGINPSDLENAWRTAKYIDKRFLLSFRGYLKQGSYFESQTRSPKGRQRVLWAVAKDMDTKELPGGVISPPWSAKSPYWKELDRRRGTSDAEIRAVTIRMEERHGISSAIRFPSQISGRSASPVKSALQLTATQRTVLASTRKRGATGSGAVTRALAAKISLPDIREHVKRV